MRILIVGCGVIGHLYARGLDRAGHDVTLLGRDPARLARMQRDGIEFVDLRTRHRERVHLRYACAVGASYDLVVLALRNDHIDDTVLREAAGWSGDSARLALFQLGFSGPHRLSRYLPGRRTLVGYAMSAGGFWDAPARRLHFDVPPGKNTALGSSGEGVTDAAREIAAVFADAGFPCQLARMPDNVYQTSALVATLAAFDRQCPALLDGTAGPDDIETLGEALGDAMRVADLLGTRPRHVSLRDVALAGRYQAREFACLGPTSRMLLSRYFRGGGEGETAKLYRELLHAGERYGVATPALGRLRLRETRTVDGFQ